jgi:hypothetical protein
MFPDFDSMTWTCMVCGDERPDAVISVAYRPIPGLEDRFPEGARVNVRFCNDRPDCAATAHGEGPWVGVARSRPVA